MENAFATSFVFEKIFENNLFPFIGFDS